MLKPNAREGLRANAAVPAVLVSIAPTCSLGAGSAWADEAVSADEGEEVAVEAVAEEAAEEEEEEEEETTWAYAGITLDSEDYGVGTVYYASSYFEGEGLVNPTTTEPYTEEELAAIEEGAAVDAEGYVAAPADAALGIGVYGSDEVYWYDADAAEEIVSHSDALYLDAGTGVLTDESGEVVAEAMD